MNIVFRFPILVYWSPLFQPSTGLGWCVRVRPCTCLIVVQKKQATSSMPKIHGWAYDVGNGLLNELDIDFKVRKVCFLVDKAMALFKRPFRARAPDSTHVGSHLSLSLRPLFFGAPQANSASLVFLLFPGGSRGSFIIKRLVFFLFPLPLYE